MTYDWRVTVPEGDSGAVAIKRFTIDGTNSIFMLKDAIQYGRAVSAHGDYTMMTRDGALWMSDTAAEWSEHLDAFYAMRRYGGRVLVNGLGIGMIVKAALTLDNVERVDVVEIDEDVIKLVGPTYDDPRVTIYHDDAYTIKWSRNTSWSVAWHDVWAQMTEDDLPLRTKLLRRYGNRTLWQGCWGQEIILRQRQLGRRRGWW